MIDWETSKWSRKHLDLMLRSYDDFKFFTLLSGSVRSGKTVTQIAKAAADLIPNRADKGKILISGKSKETIYNNILLELMALYGGKKNCDYDSSHGRLIVNSRVLGTKNDAFIRVAGANKKGNEGAIWGDTFALWLADELTLHTQAFVKLAITRLSVANSKILATTNPADILHFIYTDWIDNAKKKDVFEYLFFELTDNLNLPPEYIENVKASFSGVYFDRMIRGLWVIAEGLVYPEFDKDKHIITPEEFSKNLNEGLYKELIGGVDWGYSAEMAAGVWGVTRNNEFHLASEFYKKGKLTTDVIDWFKNEQKRLGRNLNYIFCDSAEPDRIAEMVLANLKAYASEKEIAAGCNTVRTCFRKDLVRIGTNCPNTQNELLTLRYPEQDEPGYGSETTFIGKDHACDGVLRYPIHTYRKEILGLRF